MGHYLGCYEKILCLRLESMVYGKITFNVVIVKLIAAAYQCPWDLDTIRCIDLPASGIFKEPTKKRSGDFPARRRRRLGSAGPGMVLSAVLRHKFSELKGIDIQKKLKQLGPTPCNRSMADTYPRRREALISRFRRLLLGLGQAAREVNTAGRHRKPHEINDLAVQKKYSGNLAGLYCDKLSIACTVPSLPELPANGVRIR